MYKWDFLQPKSVLKSKKSEFDGLLDDDETPPGSSVVSPELSPRPIISDSPPENNVSSLLLIPLKFLHLVGN